MVQNFQHLRLAYEILNKPLSSIAADVPTTDKAIQDLAERQGWVQWFPEPDLIVKSNEDGASDMEEVSDEFIKRTSIRLRMYNICKDILLTQKYLTLEIKIIDTANALLEEGANSLAPRDIKSLSSLYAEMTKNSVRDALASFSIGADDNGIPTVVFKDLSGQQSK